MLVGPSGSGKTTSMRLINRMIPLSDGDILLGGSQRPRSRSARPAPGDRLRDPAGRAVPPSDGRREHRDGAAPARVGQGADSSARAGAARADRARRRRDRTPLPRAALRRPAPARRCRPRAGRGSSADADGRAVRGDRPDQPREAPGRVPRAAGESQEDRRVRDPRHRRGDQDGRSHRDPARGRRAGSVRHAEGDPRATRRRLRGPSSWVPTAASSGSR